MSERLQQSIEERYKSVLAQIPAGVKLVAVSKFHPVSLIKEVYDAGQRVFGESRVKELLDKERCLPDDIQWHFIGHLQTNKVRQIIGKTALIESVDSERLLILIDEESRKKGIVTDVLLQLHVALEETKFGMSEDELIDFLASGKYEVLSNVRLRGLMTMATNTEDMDRVKKDFATASRVFRKVKEQYKDSLPLWDTLSMGMSGDWPLAVEEGANTIRIGSSIFGEREY